MAKEVHYTVQRQKKVVYGYLYEVFADDENGADEFKEKAEEYQAVPGSYIDVASKSVGYLLMNNGTWEEHEPIGINGWGSGGGGGLPPTSGSGKALVSVNGEWKEQDGYGYTEKGGQTVITWDGDTEGRDVLVLHSPYGDGNFYKVAEKQSEYPENASVEMASDEGTESVDAELTEYIGAYAYSVVGQPFVLIANAGDIEIGPFTGNAPSSGVYFITLPDGFNAMSLTYVAPDTVHKIDEKYLPASGGLPFDVLVTVNYDGNYTIDKSFNEIQSAQSQGKRIGAILCSFGTFCKFIPLTETDYGYEFEDSRLAFMSGGRIDVSTTRIRLASDDTITDDFENVTIGS